ncbi:MAG: glycerol-3-phosphate acyltransferase, partial [Candidatus Wallbacteria bacterium]|nr:glycerol-3-phosphate acyltransferase [Candidatus Wallbacteria bacterium]
MKLGMFIMVCVINYIIGSIPFAYIITLKASGKDIRQEGSGNVGATNVFRVMGILWGLLVFFLDAGKGWLAVKFSQFIINEKDFTIQLSNITLNHKIILICAVLWVVLGHIFPIFLGFRG